MKRYLGGVSLLVVASSILSCAAWFVPTPRQRLMLKPLGTANQQDPAPLLMEMDVVVFRPLSEPNRKRLGAVQEDGRIAPLSVWTDEPAFGSSLEFVVDEHDLPGYETGEITIESMISQESLSYGSRQVGGGKGPGNPHGEESERLYYLDQEKFDLEGIELSVRPHLEITW